MSNLSKTKLGLSTTIGLGTTILGAAGNILGQLLGTGTDGGNTRQGRNTAAINTFGVTRDNLFGTSIGLPSFLSKNSFQGGGLGQSRVVGTGAESQLMLYAEAVNLPGVNVVTGETRRYGFGPNVRYAKDINFNDVAVTFIGDGAGIILKVFSDWMNGIVKFDDFTTPSTKLENAPFFFRYKKEYVATEFFITVFNERNDEIAVYYLEDAFPTSIGDINLNWGSTNQLARFTVNFTYTRWTQKSVAADLANNLLTTPRQQDTSVLSMIYQAGGAAQMISTLRRPQGVGDVVNIVSAATRIFGGP